MNEKIVIVTREPQSDAIKQYLEQRNDRQRLKDYCTYNISDPCSIITLERLIHEYNSACNQNDEQQQNEFSVVIDYLLDCYVG